MSPADIWIFVILPSAVVICGTVYAIWAWNDERKLREAWVRRIHLDEWDRVRSEVFTETSGSPTDAPVLFF